MKHEVSHFISTRNSLVHAHARCRPPDKLTFAKSKFTSMEAMDIIQRSSSLWLSLLHMVPKAYGGLCPCRDYWCLNDVTEPDCYPVLHMHDFLHTGWHTDFLQIRFYENLSPDHYDCLDIPKNYIITPFRLYEFPSMPFGLKRAAQSFKHLKTITASFFNAYRIVK